MELLMPTVHIFVTGRVQGVFFRHSTRERATELGLNGWVRNLPDGRVEIEASGARSQLDLLIVWSGKGPAQAAVDKVEVEWVDEPDGASRHTSGFRLM
jgi:acylphosphatase